VRYCGQTLLSLIKSTGSKSVVLYENALLISLYSKYASNILNIYFYIFSTILHDKDNEINNNNDVILI
jgi:hypothetical protein